MIAFGEKLSDKLTKTVGVATARIEYAGGRVQYLVERVTADGRLMQEWFDESRLVVESE
jgi:hypothetical protein